MARRDVINYYIEQQSVYFEMRDNVKELDKALKDHVIEQDRFDAAQKEIETIKDNYEILSYIVLLLNKPKDKSDGVKYEKANHDLYNSLKGNSREALLDESKDALSDLKKLIKEEKTDGCK